MIELVEKLNPDYPPLDAVEKAIVKLFEEHRGEFKEELDDIGG
jgi:hypothetical protein